MARPADETRYEELVAYVRQHPLSYTGDIAEALDIPSSSVMSIIMAIETSGRALFSIEPEGRWLRWSVFREYVAANSFGQHDDFVPSRIPVVRLAEVE